MHSGLKDMLSGTVLLVVAVAAYVIGNSIPKSFAIGVGSGFMPRVAGIALGLVAISIIVSGLRGRRGGPDTDARGILPQETGPVGLTLLLILLYTTLIGYFGFIASTVAYLTAQFFVLAPPQERRPLAFVIAAVAVAVVVHQTFTRGFNLILPTGFLI